MNFMKWPPSLGGGMLKCLALKGIKVSRVHDHEMGWMLTGMCGPCAAHVPFLIGHLSQSWTLHACIPKVPCWQKIGRSSLIRVRSGMCRWTRLAPVVRSSSLLWPSDSPRWYDKGRCWNCNYQRELHTRDVRLCRQTLSECAVYILYTLPFYSLCGACYMMISIPGQRCSNSP